MFINIDKYGLLGPVRNCKVIHLPLAVVVKGASSVALLKDITTLPISINFTPNTLMQVTQKLLCILPFFFYKHNFSKTTNKHSTLASVREEHELEREISFRGVAGYNNTPIKRWWRVCVPLTSA